VLTPKRIVTAIFVVAVAGLLAGQVLGYPIILGFVETGSMSPSVEKGDGFVAVPSFVTGSPSVGDVVVFEAEEVQDGGLVTHRIVGETEEGYVTKGDANPFTDQDGGEPYVTEDDVLAEALSIGGTVVAVPRLGVAVRTARGTVAGILGLVGIGTAAGTQISGVALFVFGVALVVIASVEERAGASDRDRKRSRKRGSVIDSRLVFLGFAALILVPANFVMVGQSGVQEISTDAGVEGVEPGGSLDREVTVRNDGYIAMLVIVEPTGEAEVERGSVGLPAGEKTTVTVTTPVPESGGKRTDGIRDSRYFLLLPEPVLRSLYSVNPLLALVGVNAVLVVGIAGLVVGLLGYGKVRLRETESPKPYAKGLWSFLR